MSEQIFPASLQNAAVSNLPLGDLIQIAANQVAAGEPASARELYRAWIDNNRDHPFLYIAHFNCSALDSQIGDSASAIESLNRSIALNADFMPAYINLGGLLERNGAPARAIELWQKIANKPVPVNGSMVSYVSTALKQIARVLGDHQLPESAEAAVQLCLEINPHQKDIIEQYVALRLSQCKWPVIVPRENIDRKTLVKGIHPLSTAVFTDDPLLQLASAERYADLSAFGGPHEPDMDRRNAKIPLAKRRLRIGYVSSDLRDHAIGYLMAELFELHGKRNVEVFAYYCGIETDSALTNRIKNAVEHWTDIRNLSDDEAARKIAQDEIDILVDVNGHTRDARTGVFARRPAPVQVNWLGYPGSMGTPYHHYLIADDWIIPRKSEIYYSEKVLRLPCYQPNDRKRIVASTPPSRTDVGLPENAFVFCCFNGTHKISRFTFERWMEILARVPDSVLWLLDTSAETKARLGAFAESKGVSRERLVFAPKQPNAQHLARYGLADLFVDTVPYGAHTTASDALWMGVPVLTLSGRSFASRVCGSLVRSAGLPDLVCSSPRDYIERAVSLGTNRAKLDTYKRKLSTERDRCQLFDTNKLVRRLEALYEHMAREHNKGRTPRPDLANLKNYLEAGIDFDHETTEMLTVSDYHGYYKLKLARLHLARPMPADSRVWSKADIARAESTPRGKQSKIAKWAKTRTKRRAKASH